MLTTDIEDVELSQNVYPPSCLYLFFPNQCDNTRVEKQEEKTTRFGNFRS